MEETQFGPNIKQTIKRFASDDAFSAGVASFVVLGGGEGWWETPPESAPGCVPWIRPWMRPLDPPLGASPGSTPGCAPGCTLASTPGTWTDFVSLKVQTGKSNARRRFDFSNFQIPNVARRIAGFVMCF